MNTLLSKYKTLFIAILTIVFIIICFIFAFSGCTQDGITLLDEWDVSDVMQPYSISILELIPKSTLRIIDYTIIPDDKVYNSKASMKLSSFSTSYGNSNYSQTFCKGDKIRFEVEYPINKKPKQAEINVEYKNGNTEKLIYVFLR